MRVYIEYIYKSCYLYVMYSYYAITVYFTYYIILYHRSDAYMCSGPKAGGKKQRQLLVTV